MLDKKNYEKLRSGKKCKLILDISDDIEARVFLTPFKTGRIKIRAYLVIKSTGEQMYGVREITHSTRSIDALDIDVRNMMSTLYKRLFDYWHPIPKSPVRTTKGFAERVLSIPDITNPQNFKPYVRRGWSSCNTAKNAVNYFAYTIGAIYERYGEDATVADFYAVLEEEIDRIYHTRYEKPTRDGRIIKQRRNLIYNGLAQRWEQARAVQRYLLDNYPDMEWPRTLIPHLPTYKSISTEEIKAIAVRQYIMLLTILYRLCIAGNPLAFNALGEVVCGERIGESCAHLLGDFELYEKFGRVYIQFQLDYAGKRTDVLKNVFSYRYTVYGDFLIRMISLRKSQLAGRGILESEYMMMPFGAYEDTPWDFIPKGKVSTFLRELLVLVGCNDEWLQRAADDMFVAAQVSGNSDDLDVTAHLLRRTIATFAANGGVPLDYVDAILGHQNERNTTVDYNALDKTQEIASMMDRAIWLGSLCDTQNPAYSPVKLTGNTDYLLDGNIQYIFVADDDTYVDVDVNALESTNGLRIILPDICQSAPLQLRNPIDTTEHKRMRTIPPVWPGEEEVERWIAEAMEIDLSRFESWR